jgi:hypothetical protein
MRDRGLLYVGILLLLLGGIFMVSQLGESMSGVLGLRLGWRVTWPFLVLFVGLAFLLPLLIWWERRREIVGLLMPGAIITINGLILLFQNTVGNFESWAYLWPLELIAVAIGLLLMYLLGKRERGLTMAAAIVGGIGLVFLAVFSTAFGGEVLRCAAPLLLIGVGLSVVLMAMRNRTPRE